MRVLVEPIPVRRHQAASTYAVSTYDSEVLVGYGPSNCVTHKFVVGSERWGCESDGECLMSLLDSCDDPLQEAFHTLP